MWAIQSGSNWWVDSVSRFAGGGVGGAFCIGAANQSPVTAMSTDVDDVSDALIATISDSEEEGEASPAEAKNDSHEPPVIHSAEELDVDVAAASKRIDIIETAMRQLQATGVVNFDNDEDTSEEQTMDESFTKSFLGDVMQNSDAAFAATEPGKDRKGLLALLAN